MTGLNFILFLTCIMEVNGFICRSNIALTHKAVHPIFSPSKGNVSRIPQRLRKAALWTRVLTLDPRIRIIEVSCKTGTRGATLKNSS